MSCKCLAYFPEVLQSKLQGASFAESGGKSKTLNLGRANVKYGDAEQYPISVFAQVMKKSDLEI